MLGFELILEETERVRPETRILRLLCQKCNCLRVPFPYDEAVRVDHVEVGDAFVGPQGGGQHQHPNPNSVLGVEYDLSPR